MGIRVSSVELFADGGVCEPGSSVRTRFFSEEKGFFIELHPAEGTIYVHKKVTPPVPPLVLPVAAVNFKPAEVILPGKSMTELLAAASKK